MANFREDSQQNWSSKSTTEHINAGSFQRIADACELMSKDHAFLISEKQLYERWYREECEQNKKMARRISALQGVITKMKKKLK